MFAKPAYPRNDYLTNGTNTCSTGDLSVSVEQRDSENRYRHYDSTNNYNSPSDDKSVRLTWRHYLGSACTDEFKAVQQENMELKQQLELMKMCGRVNSNPTLKHNPSFNLLVSKCVGVAPTGNNTRPNDSKSLWDDMKDGYKKENPDLTLMGDKIIGPSKSKLKIPPKDYILPLPKPKDD
ncbi:hypothetical protein N9850_13860 [Granulosicoccus sp.]|nr:hypothetical protein [Granulosicoccus sp.]